MRDQHSEVLVVGAGPVGMFAALLLAREGIGVQVIDQAPAIAGHSYACGLHPRTLALLRDAGLHADIIDAGRRIDRIAFYEGESRRAEVRFDKASPGMPFALVLPQDELEEALANALQEARVNILWNHRLADITPGNGTVTATVDELAETATGYDVPRWETVVKRSFEISADFILGCDGQHSVVRRAAGITDHKLPTPELFVVYEFESDFEMPDEIRVVLNPGETNVLWPMAGGRYRWGFQWTKTSPDGEFPLKDRSHLWYENMPVAQTTQAHLAALIKERAPWFPVPTASVDWATDVVFERRLARDFGHLRCWIAGDAAHQTGPVGMQSMNVGMREAASLAHNIRKALRDTGTTAPLEDYQDEFVAEWQRLLGVTSQLEVAHKSRPAALRYAPSLLSCLPASGPELDAMVDQLGFRLKEFAAPTTHRR